MPITLLAVAVAGIAISMPAAGSAPESGALLAQYQSLGRQEEAPPKPDEAPEETPDARPPSMSSGAKPIPPSRKGMEPRSQTPQCSWIGKRAVRVLLRDDLIAADGFLRFYNTFSCPVAHLGEAFGCTLGLSDDAPAEAVEARVDVCWTDPETTSAPATGIPVETPPPKGEAPAPEPEPGGSQ